MKLRKCLRLSKGDVVNVYEDAVVSNGKVEYFWENDRGKEVMLKAVEDNKAYYRNSADLVTYPNRDFPVIKKGDIVSVRELDKGYLQHLFELVEV